MSEEQYYIQNVKTKEYIKGFQHGDPIWTEDIKNAALYNEMDALRILRKLEKRGYVILMIEKR